MTSGGSDRPGDVLAQPTRARLFAHLARLGRPAGTTELAAGVGLHPNGVRVHLQRLEAAGLVTRERSPQPVGRPLDSWSVAADALPGAEPPDAYRQLARWLARSTPPRPARLREVERSGRELGREFPATLAFFDHAAWLLYAALGPFALGLGFYAFVLGRFQPRQLVVGIGDHWVTGGALAISTVAAGRIALAAQRLNVLPGAHGAQKTIALALWCVTMLWLPALVAAELLRPRLTYNVRRWSTVFPVGMYAACSFIVGELTQTPGITDFARVWVWVSLAVWLAVFAGMAARTPRLAVDPANSRT